MTYLLAGMIPSQDVKAATMTRAMDVTVVAVPGILVGFKALKTNSRLHCFLPPLRW